MSLKGINTNKKAVYNNCWHGSSLILFNKRPDFRMSLNFRITLSYFINSLWNQPQFMFPKMNPLKEASNNVRPSYGSPERS